MSVESLTDTKARHKDFISKSFINLAAYSWEGHCASGRGVVFVSFNQETESMEVRYAPADLLEGVTRKMAEEYDPKEQFVVVIEETDGQQHDYRIGDASMTPPAAYEIRNAAREQEEEVDEEAEAKEESEGRYPESFPTIVLAFVVIGDGEYGTEASELVFDALSKIKFTGFCEYYAADVPTDKLPLYIVSFALVSDQGQKPAIPYIEALTALMEDKVGDEYTKLSLVACQHDTLAKAHARMLFRGTAEFKEGSLERIVCDEESLFIAGCHERLRPE